MIDLRRYIRPGDAVVIGQATAEPRSLVEALIEQRHHLAPLRVFVGTSYTGLLRPEHADALRFTGFGAVGQTGALVQAGVLDVLPVHIGSIPTLIATGRIPVDVALLQLSAPGPDGAHSAGLVSDYVLPAVAAAATVIAEINPRVPFTHGDTLVPAARLAATVVDERPLIPVERRAALPEDTVIAARLGELIPDGATIQFGIGGTPDAVLGALRGHRDLGVHSGLLSDAFVDLIESGAVTNRCKEIDPGVSVSGSLFGTDRLYDWARDNPALSMRTSLYTHGATVLAQLGSLWAINSAVEVDLSGQINGESAGGRYVGTVGGALAFARAAITSPHGRSVIALPSTARGGSVTRIVARLADGVVSTPRADADLIVTEHGVADLRGASLGERAERLLAIADPRHQPQLEASLR